MSNWFKGSYRTQGIIYDYTCVWQREGDIVFWRAELGEPAVHSASGRVGESASDSELLVVISACIEREIEALEDSGEPRQQSARRAPAIKRTRSESIHGRSVRPLRALPRRAGA